MRDHSLFSGDANVDYAWKLGNFAVGPAWNLIAALDQVAFCGATGPGGKVTWNMAKGIALETTGFMQGHMDRDGRYWLGGDLTLQWVGSF